MQVTLIARKSSIIEKSDAFQTYYTLLAWEGSDLLLNKKFIDVLWFDRAGNARFGAPIFKSTTETKSRVLFQFGGQNTMKLNYKPELDRILFDHLSPPPANQNNTTDLEGVYEYYGADLSYDAYDWKKGKWVYVADVDAVFQKALDAGAEKIMPPTDQFYGNREAGVKDPQGNQWWMATRIEIVSEEEMIRRATKG